jgi:hypothetical protein
MLRPLALVLVLVAAGCSLGGDDSPIQASELNRLVLQPQDLPKTFFRFDEGRQIGVDSPGGRRADPERYGRIDGWKARYRRADSEKAPGPLVIESRADVFDSSGGAKDDLDAARADLRESELGWQPIDEPGLGDESFAVTLVQSVTGGDVRYYQVLWRDGNATASLNVNGFDPGLALGDTLELARKQERRMSEAAGSS